jgi:hypothetical protein
MAALQRGQCRLGPVLLAGPIHGDVGGYHELTCSKKVRVVGQVKAVSRRKGEGLPGVPRDLTNLQVGETHFRLVKL